MPFEWYFGGAWVVLLRCCLGAAYVLLSCCLCGAWALLTICNHNGSQIARVAHAMRTPVFGVRA
eukprot:6238357-Lingulodinium_polyedra.AAC.1